MALCAPNWPSARMSRRRRSVGLHRRSVRNASVPRAARAGPSGPPDSHGARRHLGDAPSVDGMRRSTEHAGHPGNRSPTLRRLPGPEGGSPADGRARQLGLLIRGIGLAILPVDVLEIVVGVAFGEPRAIVLGIGSVAFALWLIHLSRRPDRLGLEVDDHPSRHGDPGPDRRRGRARAGRFGGHGHRRAPAGRPRAAVPGQSRRRQGRSSRPSRSASDRSWPGWSSHGAIACRPRSPAPWRSSTVRPGVRLPAALPLGGRAGG